MGGIVTPNLTEEFWKNYLAGFEAKNPGVKVKFIYPPGGPGASSDAYYKTLLASEKFPDVLFGVTTSEFVGGGALAPFPIDDEIKTAIPNYESYQIKGKLYELPTQAQPSPCLYYNKSMFDKAGITAVPKTFEEWDAAFAKLKASGVTPLLIQGADFPQLYTGAFMLPSSIGAVPDFYIQRNEKKITFAGSEFEKTLEWLFKWQKAGYVNEGAAGLSFVQSQTDFLAGKAAVYPMGSWFAGEASKNKPNFEIGVAVPPSLDGKQRVIATVYGVALISSTSKHQEAAIKLAKYMAFDEETSRARLKTDALISTLKPKPLTYEADPVTQATFDTFEGSEIVPFLSGQGDNLPVLGFEDHVKLLTQKMLTGKGDAKSFAKELDDFWDRQQK